MIISHFNKILLSIIAILISLLIMFNKTNQVNTTLNTHWWPVQSIDTMKYSRDLSREKLNDPLFNKVIERQISLIKNAGATHVAIGTPYDDEFIPILKRWVSAARKYELNVWFRGNFSGWEGWFKYLKISREEHTKKTREFIINNPGLFADGDIFTSCTECENGGPGDPRLNGDASGHRSFLIGEYREVKKAFKSINKNVIANYYSMNGDVARLVMDRHTTRALDGIVVVDHYVASADNLATDIREITELSGGKVVLGEFGAPIPDIHGTMTQADQAQWLGEALDKLAGIESLIGINYWVGVGGSSALWNDRGVARKAVSVITSFYKPSLLTGIVNDSLGHPIAGATVQLANRQVITDKKGFFHIPYRKNDTVLYVKALGYIDKDFKINKNASPLLINMNIKDPGVFYKIRKFILNILPL